MSSYSTPRTQLDFGPTFLQMGYLSCYCKIQLIESLKSENIYGMNSKRFLADTW